MYVNRVKCHVAAKKEPTPEVKSSEAVEADINEVKRYTVQNSVQITMGDVLKDAVGDYDVRIGALIEQEVVDEALRFSGCEFTINDVKSAIGLALCKHLGIEV